MGAEEVAGGVSPISFDGHGAPVSPPGSDDLHMDYALIVGSERLLAEALGVALVEHGFEILVATELSDALSHARNYRPSVVLLDLGDPNSFNIKVGKEILSESPISKVVMVTSGHHSRAHVAVMRAGFHGCVTRATTLKGVLGVVQAALEGHFVVPHELAEPAEDSMMSENPHAARLARQLTTREWQVLALLAEGKRNRDIGRVLSISPNTVRAHVQRILSKLEANNRLEAVTFAIKHDLVRTSPIGESESMTFEPVGAANA